ncbi:hypothetical protein EON64_02085 [archaeon]|nr:MAG: hypothetical protein EON64_02085 [archaeon]
MLPFTPQQNPKVKFAVLPESSVNYHLHQNAKSSSRSSGSSAGRDDIDNILDMLNSPSMLQAGIAPTPLLSPYKPSAPSTSFSPEMAKSSAQVFSQFGLATELFTPDPQEDVGSDENHSANVTPRKNADLLSSSWDENSVDLSLPAHGNNFKTHSQLGDAQQGGAGKSLQTKSMSFNDNYVSSSASNSNHAAAYLLSNQSSKQGTSGTSCVSALVSTPFPSSTGSSADAMKLIDEKIAAGKELQQRTRCDACYTICMCMSICDLHVRSLPLLYICAIRCSRVVVAGSSYSRGLKASVFSKYACDCLLCVHCNFRVVHFMHSTWDGSIDYMFVRNNMPNRDKLSRKLQSAPDSVAYCCQCNWLSESKERTLVQGVTTDPQWVCTGH